MSIDSLDNRGTTKLVREIFQTTDDPKSSWFPNQPTLHTHLEEILRDDLLKKLTSEGVKADDKIVMGLGDERYVNGYVFAKATSNGLVDNLSPVFVVRYGLTENVFEGYNFRIYKLPFIPCDEPTEIQNFTQTNSETVQLKVDDEGYEGLSQLLEFMYKNTETWALSHPRALKMEIAFNDPRPMLRNFNHHYFAEGYWNEQPGL